MSEKLKFETDIKKILEKDNRYHSDAYVFLFEALEYTLNKIGKRRHVTGRELLEGIVELLRERYGLLALELCRRWGIRRTIDFGNMVFNLVDNGLMRKTEEDSISDFKEVFSLKKELYTKYVIDVKNLDTDAGPPPDEEADE